MLSSFQGSSLRQSSHPQSSKATDCPASVMMGKAQQGCPCRRFLGEKKHEFVTPPLPCAMSSWYFVNARLKPEWAVWGREGGGKPSLRTLPVSRLCRPPFSLHRRCGRSVKRRNEIRSLDSHRPETCQSRVLSVCPVPYLCLGAKGTHLLRVA